MKKLLNTLYVTSEGAWVHKDGANVVVKVEGQERGRAPLHLLGSVICFGQVSVSPELMYACAENGVSITFLGYSGRFLARVEGPTSGNVLLRRAQHATSLADPFPIARSMVAAKIVGQRGVIRRHMRDHGDADGFLAEAEPRLTRAARLVLEATDGDAIRGYEGEAANAYLGVFGRLIRVSDISFNGRSRRPPKDPVNAVLSFLYVLLSADCRAALESVGLDPQMGFLHSDRPGRPSLALDLMEEFRAPLADRTCLSLFNRKQLRPRSFRYEETGAVLLDDEARKTVLAAWQMRKRISMRHAFLGESLPLGLFPHVQSQLLARHLRGDLDGYPPFIWK